MKESRRRKLKSVLPYILWGIFAFLFGICGMLGILSFAGIAFLPPAPTALRIDIEPLADSARGAVVSAAVTWFGGTIALCTYFLTHVQKERHNSDQERRERDLSELHRLETEFASYATDFSSEIPLRQINGAIGLGELAIIPDPRRLEIDGRLKKSDVREIVTEVEMFEANVASWPMKWRSQKSPENFPYYHRSVNRLSAALHQWDDVASRAVAMRTIVNLSNWASEHNKNLTDEPLLHELVNALAESNRVAWHRFLIDAKFGLAAGITIDDLTNMLGVSGEPNFPFKSLDLSPWENFKKFFKMYLEDEVGRLNTDYLRPNDIHDHIQRRTIAIRADQFRGTQACLLHALRCLSLTPDTSGMPICPDFYNDDLSLSDSPEALRVKLSEYFAELADWPLERIEFKRLQARRNLDLSDVQMFGLACGPLLLHGVNFERANFSGSLLFGSRFDASICVNALFIGSYCERSSFEFCDCTNANFMYSSLRGSSLGSAMCKKAVFGFTDCSGAYFVRVNLEGAKIGSAEFGQSGGAKTVFAAHEWKAADFHVLSPLDSGLLATTEEINVALITYLEGGWPDGIVNESDVVDD